MRNTIDVDDPFRYDPIGNFKKLRHKDKFRAICCQRANMRMYEFEHKKLCGLLAAKKKREDEELKSQMLYETRQDLCDAYLISEIDDETYLEQVRLYEKSAPSHWRMTDRITWLEIMLKEQWAIYHDMWDIYNTTHDPVMPKSYGYDPRKRISKYNYPREDWGKTRENIYQHQKRKGKK